MPRVFIEIVNVDDDGRSLGAYRTEVSLDLLERAKYPGMLLERAMHEALCNAGYKQ